MLQEFAIEPTVLDCWSRYDYFMADCGVEKGRLVAEFPAAQWKNHVWRAVSENPKRTPKDEQRIQYHLQHTAEAKLVYTARQYHFQPNAPCWLDQAAREHAAKKFRLIVSATPAAGKPDAVHVEEFDKHDVAAWQVDTTCSIERTPEAIAGLTRLLCARTMVVKLLDPHFRSDHGRFRKTFRSLFETICQVADSKVRIEVHCGYKESEDKCADKEQSAQDFTAKLLDEWPELIPPGRKVLFYQWAEQPLGEQLHRRLILSERGGILVEAGLDAGPEGQTTTASLLSTAEHLRFWKGLAIPGSAGPSPDALFKFCGDVDVTGVARATGHGQPRRWR